MKHWSVEPEKMGKKLENKNDSNVAIEEKLNCLKDSIKGILTRLETFTSGKAVSKDTSITEIETSKNLEIIELDIEHISQRIETNEQRNKWQFEKNNVAIGCLVLLKENDLPPCKWAMARILEVIYGTDGKVRVVKLKTATGILARSISKISLTNRR
ncbi:DUF5641 domain-containing protein [Trichonephila clavipes]|nr:DUF5641 domain-containing protein [Trichonephila clavipes]